MVAEIWASVISSFVDQLVALNSELDGFMPEAIDIEVFYFMKKNEN